MATDEAPHTTAHGCSIRRSAAAASGAAVDETREQTGAPNADAGTNVPVVPCGAGPFLLPQSSDGTCGGAILWRTTCVPSQGVEFQELCLGALILIELTTHYDQYRRPLGAFLTTRLRRFWRLR